MYASATISQASSFLEAHDSHYIASAQTLGRGRSEMLRWSHCAMVSDSRVRSLESVPPTQRWLCCRQMEKRCVPTASLGKLLKYDKYAEQQLCWKAEKCDDKVESFGFKDGSCSCCPLDTTTEAAYHQLLWTNQRAGSLVVNHTLEPLKCLCLIVSNGPASILHGKPQLDVCRWRVLRSKKLTFPRRQCCACPTVHRQSTGADFYQAEQDGSTTAWSC